jgi:hypothetical protein
LQPIRSNGRKRACKGKPNGLGGMRTEGKYLPARNVNVVDRNMAGVIK